MRINNITSERLDKQLQYLLDVFGAEMLFFILQLCLIRVLPVYCISRKSLKIRSSVSQKVLRCLQPNFDCLSTLPLSLIIQKWTSLGTSGRLQNRHLRKIMWLLSDFFKFTNSIGLNLNLPLRSICIKSTPSPNMTSLVTSGQLLVNTHYNASRPNNNYLPSGLMYC